MQIRRYPISCAEPVTVQQPIVVTGKPISRGAEEGGHASTEGKKGFILFLHFSNCSGQSLPDFVPVHDVPECMDEYHPVIPVLEIVRMLPDIEDHEDLQAREHVQIIVLYLQDQRSSCFVPVTDRSPARALYARCRCGELLFEAVKITLFVIDCFRQVALRQSVSTVPRRGARFCQKNVWSLIPPSCHESSFAVALTSKSVFSLRSLSNFSRMAFAPFTYLVVFCVMKGQLIFRDVRCKCLGVIRQFTKCGELFHW